MLNVTLQFVEAVDMQQRATTDTKTAYSLSLLVLLKQDLDRPQYASEIENDLIIQAQSFINVSHG